MKSHAIILAGSNLTETSLHSGSKGNETTSLTSFSGRVGSASTALHTGSQVLIKSLKPKEVCKSKIRGANPRQLVCKQVILVVSMSVSPADMIAKSTSTLSSWGPYSENTKFWLQIFFALQIDQSAGRSNCWKQFEQSGPKTTPAASQPQ